MSGAETYFTNVRPDVFREIENRGKKTDSVGVNVGWGTNVDSMLLQKGKLKFISGKNTYEKLISQIVPMNENKSPSPKKKQKMDTPSPAPASRPESPLIITWYVRRMQMSKNDQLDQLPEYFHNPDLPSYTAFLKSPEGLLLKDYSNYIKNKL